MATVEDITKKFPEAQLVGGKYVVWREGRNVELGGFGMADGAFSLTDEGIALLDTVVVDEATAKPKKGKAAAADDTPEV